MLKSILKLECCMLYLQQGFVMQGLDRLYQFVIIDLPKKEHVKFVPPETANFDKLGRIRLQFHIVINTKIDPILDCISKEMLRCLHQYIQKVHTTYKT